MKSLFHYLIISVVLVSALPAAARRCTGSAHCIACTNCSQCKYCNAGGTCGVCSGGNADDTPPEPEAPNAYHEQHSADHELPADNGAQSSSVSNLYDHSQTSTPADTTTSGKEFPLFGCLVVAVLLYLLFRRNNSKR